MRRYHDETRAFFERQRADMLTALNREELERRVRMLSSDGMSDYQIAELTLLHVDQVRALIAEPARDAHR